MLGCPIIYKALADTFALFEEFEDTPEAGEGSNAKDGGDDNILNHARGRFMNTQI